MQNPIAALFLDYSARKLDEMTRCLDACLGRLSDEQVWHRDAAHENAIGNLILHLCGNMRQWILHGVGGVPDVRTRDAEFSAAGGYTGQQLMAIFGETVAEAKAVLAELPHERLEDRVNPQPDAVKDDVSKLDAIYQVVGHVQQHTGQIILLTKQMAGKDLDLTIPRPR
jgi:uncharacterized damage-inducible protein DinB